MSRGSKKRAIAREKKQTQCPHPPQWKTQMMDGSVKCQCGYVFGYLGLDGLLHREPQI